MKLGLLFLSSPICSFGLNNESQKKRDRGRQRKKRDRDRDTQRKGKEEEGERKGGREEGSVNVHSSTKNFVLVSWIAKGYFPPRAITLICKWYL